MSVRAMSRVFELGRSASLSPGQRLVLLVVADHSDDSGRCWPSYERIAERAGIDRRSAIRAVEALCRDGWIRVVRRRAPQNFSQTNCLQLTLNGRLTPTTNNRGGGSDKMSPPPGDTLSLPPSDKMSLPVVTGCHHPPSDKLSPPDKGACGRTRKSPPLPSVIKGGGDVPNSAPAEDTAVNEATRTRLYNLAAGFWQAKQGAKQFTLSEAHERMCAAVQRGQLTAAQIEAWLVEHPEHDLWPGQMLSQIRQANRALAAVARRERVQREHQERAAGEQRLQREQADLAERVHAALDGLDAEALGRLKTRALATAPSEFVRRSWRLADPRCSRLLRLAMTQIVEADRKAAGEAQP